jgi:glyoxylase-like metal-dependent hydrolase (beta-lactamase superfamily II)
MDTSSAVHRRVLAPPLPASRVGPVLTTPDAVDHRQLLPPRPIQIGDLRLLALTDGLFHPEPRYFSPEAGDEQHRGLFDSRQGSLCTLPIGCFLITGIPRRLVLVDAGLGPATLSCTSTEPGDAASYGYLRGGQLIAQLTASSVDPAAITDVIVTHLHADHCGWLAHADSQPLASARIWVSGDEYEYFQRVTDEPGLLKGLSESEQDYYRLQQCQLRELHASGSVQLVASTTVAPGVTTMPTPGHTPGHLAVEVTSGDERLLLLGDAVTCPIQLARPTWHSIGDVDVEEADRTRRRLWRELQRPGTRGVGSHFPELRPGHVYPGQPDIWY